jgi:hypothetical protein
MQKSRVAMAGTSISTGGSASADSRETSSYTPSATLSINPPVDARAPISTNATLQDSAVEDRTSRPGDSKPTSSPPASGSLHLSVPMTASTPTSADSQAKNRSGLLPALTQRPDVHARPPAEQSEQDGVQPSLSSQHSQTRTRTENSSGATTTHLQSNGATHDRVAPPTAPSNTSHTSSNATFFSLPRELNIAMNYVIRRVPGDATRNGFIASVLVQHKALLWQLCVQGHITQQRLAEVRHSLY